MTERVPLTNVTLFFCTLQCTCMSYFYPENWVSGRENHQSILRRTLCNWNLCCISWTCMLETFKSEIMIPFEFSSNTSHIFCALNWRARDTFRNIKKVTFEGYSLVLLSRAEGRSIDCQTGRMETKTQRDWCVYYRLLSISKCQILVCQELLGKKNNRWISFDYPGWGCPLGLSSAQTGSLCSCPILEVTLVNLLLNHVNSFTVSSVEFPRYIPAFATGLDT